MRKVSSLSFENETIFVGLDVHKKNWKVNSRMGSIEVASFSQDPNPDQLNRYFRKNFPGARIHVAYEAGFCGFGIQRSLNKLGIDCIVVNAADVAATDKDRKRKDDKRDARKLCRQLANGDLKGIYIPDPMVEHARSLVRQRYRLRQDQTRCKNRIKQFLLFNGLQLPGPERWNKKYVQDLQALDCGSVSLKSALNLAVKEYLHVRDLLKEATLTIRVLSRQEPFASVQKYVQSIDGVGLINGMVIQTEIQDISRFKTLDSLCDYAGFVPDISSSGETVKVRGITHRCNEFLREAIIESSWILIRKDPAMLMKYKTYTQRMNENKAIIRICKHLLSRLRYVWMNKKEYVRGIV